VDPRAGDTVLLCSDGLHGLLKDEEIGAVLLANMPLDETCATLIRLANEAGGNDNISTCVLRLE